MLLWSLLWAGIDGAFLSGGIHLVLEFRKGDNVEATFGLSPDESSPGMWMVDHAILMLGSFCSSQSCSTPETKNLSCLALSTFLDLTCQIYWDNALNSATEKPLASLENYPSLIFRATIAEVTVLAQGFDPNGRLTASRFSARWRARTHQAGNVATRAFIGEF
ncbi:hypothetical protein CPB86DRAFT_801313 [Serendipita vermifera]|nr:hypothetical protein CPB86DRAFT_801313 [Serendipita vermifera]